MQAKKMLRFVLLSCTFFSIASPAQQVERHKVVVAYVYNFAKNVKWENEAQLTEFQFHIITQDESFKQEFNKLAASKTIRGKPIRIHFSSKPDNSTGTQLIFAGK